MSLLMDALKKAEQAKRQAQTDSQAAGEPAPAKPSLELEPLQSAPAAATPSPGVLPELPAAMDALDEQFLSQATAPKVKPAAPKKPAGTAAAPKPPPVIRAEPRPDVQARIQNVFAAKQPPAGGNKLFAILVGAGTLVAIVGIGIYFWLQLHPAGSLQAARQPLAALPRPPAVPPPAPVAPPASIPKSEAGAQPAPAAATATKAAPAPALPQAAGMESPIRVTRGTVKLDPGLAQGFEAFNGGDLEAAAASYRQVLQADPQNADALHGLAAIALRQGHPEEAGHYYQRAVDTDPLDAIAQAELAGLRGQGNPVAAESRLKTLIAGQPEQPALQFALGNVFAGQGRWAEAQQAYFNAFTGDPENPDYLFNLAVSLDQLHQGKLAAQYYNLALAAAARRPAGFDKAQAANRLRELQP